MLYAHFIINTVSLCRLTDLETQPNKTSAENWAFASRRALFLEPAKETFRKLIAVNFNS